MGKQRMPLRRCTSQAWARLDFLRCHFRSRLLQLRHLREVTRGHDKSVTDRDDCNSAETCKGKYRAIIGNHGGGSNQVEKTVPGNDNRPQRFEPLKTAGCDRCRQRNAPGKLHPGALAICAVALAQRKYSPLGIDRPTLRHHEPRRSESSPSALRALATTSSRVAWLRPAPISQASKTVRLIETTHHRDETLRAFQS